MILFNFQITAMAEENATVWATAIAKKATRLQTAWTQEQVGALTVDLLEKRTNHHSTQFFRSSPSYCSSFSYVPSSLTFDEEEEMIGRCWQKKPGSVAFSHRRHHPPKKKSLPNLPASKSQLRLQLVKSPTVPVKLFCLQVKSTLLQRRPEVLPLTWLEVAQWWARWEAGPLVSPDLQENLQLLRQRQQQHRKMRNRLKRTLFNL